MANLPAEQIVRHPSSAARWTLQEPAVGALEAVPQAIHGADIPETVRHLLALRGLRGEEALEAFMNPRLASLSDPFLLPEMDRAVKRLLAAVDAGEKVILYGDYDVDGVTSLTLMCEVLTAYGLKPTCFLPLRMEEGYGLSLDGLARCFEEMGKPQLLVALDCGTGSVAEVAWLRSQGVDCVIVDHHEPGPVRPDCVALVNPKVTGEMTYFCTVGLVFKVAHALMKTRRAEGLDLKDFLDLVALGTVADLVPLCDENRVLVKRGLEKLGATKRPGLQALKEVARLDGSVQTQHIGYRLGPRLNAAGRLDTAQTALELLQSPDLGSARECSDLLDAHNRERQAVELAVQKEAQLMIEADPTLAEGECIILGSRTWHPGVVGIVASRLMRDCYRPALLLAFGEDGMGKGSGRSVAGISLVAALNDCRHLLEKGGGHAMAVGVSLREERLVDFRQAMCLAVAAQIKGEELTPCLDLAAEVTLSGLDDKFFEAYAKMEPFGMSNPEPVFLCRNVRPRLPGNVIKDKHWSLFLSQGTASRQAIWFNAPVRDAPPPPWDVALKLQRQTWRGRESWQLMITQARAHVAA